MLFQISFQSKNGGKLSFDCRCTATAGIGEKPGMWLKSLSVVCFSEPKCRFSLWPTYLVLSKYFQYFSTIEE